VLNQRGSQRGGLAGCRQGEPARWYRRITIDRERLPAAPRLWQTNLTPIDPTCAHQAKTHRPFRPKRDTEPRRNAPIGLALRGSCLYQSSQGAKRPHDLVLGIVEMGCNANYVVTRRHHVAFVG